MKHLVEFVGTVTFVAFIAGKVTGVLAAWSWWWLLMTAVPTFAWLIGKA